jgi:hypothetical protein
LAFVCGDLEPDDLPEDTENTDADLEAFHEELDHVFGAAFGDAHAARGDDASPTPGERLLYALGQLYRLHKHRRLLIQPSDFDIEDLACVIGVADELEFVIEDRNGNHYHFPSEVLRVRPEGRFPWQLLTVWEWAAEQRLDAFRADGWD